MDFCVNAVPGVTCVSQVKGQVLLEHRLCVLQQTMSVWETMRGGLNELRKQIRLEKSIDKGHDDLLDYKEFKAYISSKLAEMAGGKDTLYDCAGLVALHIACSVRCTQASASIRIVQSVHLGGAFLKLAGTGCMPCSSTHIDWAPLQQQPYSSAAA
jgi:hypothetical protein